MTTEDDDRTQQMAGATGELFAALAEDLKAVLVDEVDRIRREFGDSLRDSKQASMLLGGAAVLGALAAGTSAAALVRGLSGFLPRPVAAAAATLIYAAGAAGLTSMGLAELRRARESLPRGGEANSAPASGRGPR